MSEQDPGVFYPRVQRLEHRHRAMKMITLLALVGGMFWVFEGRALYRRLVIGYASVPENQRTGDGFIALMFPRVTKKAERLTIAKADLEQVLTGLRNLGYVSIGVRDVEDFYRRDRPLPPRAVLIALERDTPESVALADEALEKARMRGIVFLNKTRQPGERGNQRLALPPHALEQMRKSGAWDIGWVSDQEPRRAAGEPVRPAVLDLGESKHAWTRNPFRYPVRFIMSRSGFNDGNKLMSALRIYRVRADRTPEESIHTIAASWPRKTAFTDEFKVAGLGLDWVSERGVVVSIGNRLVLVPTPKQKTASVFLSGTEGWRDCVAEFELSKYRRDAWLYARSADDRWVRLGARNGYWYLQEKTGRDHKPRTIARAPMTIATGLPARVRLVLKGPWALVHVNGRMQYGKAIRVHSGIDQGRIELDTYDEKPAAALAVVTRFYAAPLNERWLSLNREALASAGAQATQDLLEGVRERAVFASVLSPRWLDVLADGRVTPTDADRELVRNLAGYYRCLLVPMVDFAAPDARLPADRAAADRMLEDLLASLRGSEAAGLNLRLSSARAAGAQTEYLLSRLRVRLHEQKRRLWLTVEPGAAHPWLREADGLLRPAGQVGPGAALLDPVAPPRAPQGGAA